MSYLGPRWQPSIERLDPSDPINKGLVGFWPLDEGHRAFARDLSPWRRHLTSATWPTRTLTQRGRATNFAGGSSQYLQSSSFIWPGGREAAISVWINVAGSTNGSPWDFGGGRSLVSGNAFYSHLPYGDNNAYFYYGNVGDGEISTSLASYLNKWTHIAWSTSATRKAIWINARRVNTSTTVPAAAVASGSNAYIGYSSASMMYHYGAMRYLRLRTRAWTDGEVSRLFQNELAGIAGARPAWWWMGGSSAAWVETISETATGGETFTAIRAAAEALSGAATGAEAFAAVQAHAASASETATGGEAFTAAAAASQSPSEGATGGEAFSAAMAVALGLAETVAGDEAFPAALATTLTISETSTLAELFRIASALLPAPAERTVTWPYAARAATWIAEAREITWADPGRSVTWRQ